MIARTTGSCLAVLLLAACGSSNTLDPNATRNTIAIRVVNLFSAGAGATGPGVDIYRGQSAGLGAAREAHPVVSNLAYGAASPVFHPLTKSDLLEFFDTGSTARTGTFAGFEQDTSAWHDGDVITLFINGDSTSGSGTAFQPSYETRYENNTMDTPAADAAKATLYIQDAWRGGYSSQDSGLYLGSGGTCLVSSTAGGSDPTLIVSGAHTFTFAPGSITVGMFPNPSSGPPDCSGTPVAGPITVSSAAAGTRTWLSLYGTSWTDKRLLTLPFQ